MRTPEWQSGDERARLAAICAEDPNLASLGTALQTRWGPSLRKARRAHRSRRTAPPALRR